MITFYFYENYLFIRPAFSRIEDAFQCKKNNKLALTIIQLFEQFREFENNDLLFLYTDCLEKVRYYASKHCKKNKKGKCKNYCL